MFYGERCRRSRNGNDCLYRSEVCTAGTRDAARWARELSRGAVPGDFEGSRFAHVGEVEDTGDRAAARSGTDGISRSVFVARWRGVVSGRGLGIAEGRRASVAISVEGFAAVGV